MIACPFDRSKASLAQFIQQVLNSEIHVPQDALKELGVEDFVSVNRNCDAPARSVLVDVVAAA